VSGGGAALDLLLGGELGLLFSATFLLTCLLVAVTVRRRSLLTAVALPPLLFVGCAVLAAKVDGRASGARELGLDVATTLALSAPVLFAGTGAAAAIALVRAVLGLLRR
jgi:outer membrane murein-binding lipoprotein Lpp